MYLNKNKKFLFLIIICFSFFYNTQLLALLESKHEPSDLAIERATNQNLAQDLTWLRLIHFRVTPKIAQQSDVLSPEFFLAYNKDLHNEHLGLIRPEQELIASLEAFFAEIPVNQNAHAQCRFPARYFWLSQKLDLSSAPKPHCERLQNWAKFDSLESVSLLMVSGYFGNPASTFGHLLVKLNNSEFRASSGNLLDQSINYGAEVPDSEPIPIYIAKGLTGGYVSRFADKKYYTQDLVYSKHEFRDIWEYELELTDEQNRLLVYHVWEMLGKKSVYYFLKENCGYRIAELLELVTGHTITPNHQAWYLPVTVFQKLEGLEDSKYIRKVTFLPSSQRKLYRSFNQFNQNEALVVNKIISNPDLLTGNLLENLERQQQSKVIDFLLDYYQYKLNQADSEDADKKQLLAHKNALILKRFKLPIYEEKQVIDVPEIVSPAKGAKPTLLSVGFGNSDEIDAIYELRIALLHSDSLSNSKGSLEHSELSAFDLNLEFSETASVSIKKFDIISIQKLGLEKIGLYGEKDKTWRVSTGFEQTDLSCIKCTNFYLNGGMGTVYKFSDSLITYPMLNAKYIAENNTFEVTPDIGLLFTHNDRLKSEFIAGYKWNVKNGQRDEYAKVESRYSFTNNHTLRFSYEKFRGEEIKFSYYKYF